MSHPSPVPALPDRPAPTLPTPPAPAAPASRPQPLPAPVPGPALGSRALGAVRRRAAGDDRGQATAEYGLVVIVAATIAVAIIAWATQSGAITGFFDAVVERLTSFL